MSDRRPSHGRNVASGFDDPEASLTSRLVERNKSAVVQFTYDVGCWSAALLFAALIRFDLDYSQVNVRVLLATIPLAAAAQVIAGPIFGLYRRRWPVGSFDEVSALARSTVVATGLLYLVNLVRLPRLPRAVPLAAGVGALLLMAGGRYVWRLLDERRRRPSGDGCQRLLVFGAGDAASQVVRAMLRDPKSRYLPIALLDDDPANRNRRIMGVPVVGDRTRLADVAKGLHADALLIAIPSADNEHILKISELAAAIGLPVKVLPPVSELIGGKVGVSDIRELTTADLLGRHEIHTDVESIAGYVSGKRVLVTGAGGSIGSELCRQIYRFAPAELIMLDRDESALHAVQLSIYGKAMMDSPDLVLADLRDRCAVERVISAQRPQVIFHAAALKHLPLLERYPAEAVKTNVWATLDLLELAVAYGVDRFVNVSTDKAADPCSVLGYTKRITERLTSYMATEGSTVCLSVRFGNVLGSRGSVLTTFHAQIERGGPLTVTHPDVTRFFMTVEEAVELVVQAGAIGRAGEVLVLDMGKPVRIDDVAHILKTRAPHSVAIRYTGLRMGEKLHEVLLGEEEKDQRPFHPLISHVEVEPMSPFSARRINVGAEDPTLISHLAFMCAANANVRADG